MNFVIDEIVSAAEYVLENVNCKTILFYGEMGVGKTTLIKAIVNVLGGKMNATSPTFSIINEYEVKNGMVYHFDCYRIENPYEALDLGIEEYFDSDDWVLVEWPAKIDVLLPKDAVKLHLKLNKSGSRALDLELVNSNF